MPQALNKEKSKSAFDEEVYKKLGINELILFCVYSVNNSQENCTIERLVKECFTLFPKAFSFNNFPQWPDSRKLDRPLRALRNKKLIKGDPKSKFSLTDLGKKTIKDTAKFLTQKKLW
ncbi:MAG: hypothetical protein NTU58_01270 [Candidatus Nealsonbacteria bacterium]|nr:hypothetical protein [Candidatus Nealsonbacteria bacterium]